MTELGGPKLYSGKPRITVSAAAISATSSSVSRHDSACSGVCASAGIMRARPVAAVKCGGRVLGQVVAMTLLRDLGEVSQADLATTLMIDRTNLVGLLNELETAGLIERRRSPQDRRRHTVVLTPAGRERLAKVEFALMDAEGRVLGALDAEQRDALYVLLQQATGGLSTCSGC